MTRALVVPVQADDGHRFELIGRVPQQPRAQLLWLPALGVSARNYQPFADALAAPGYAALCSQYGLYPFARTGAALEEFVQRSLADYRQLAQELGLRSWPR